MKILASTIAFFIGLQCMLAQVYPHEETFREGLSLTPYDSIMLSQMPELDIVPVLKSSELPYFLDNSDLPYYRPIYEQVASECGQVSGIGYNFTYEINRLRDLPADDPDNQYPPHFPYNFANQGTGWWGASYFHSFEVLKSLGCPSVTRYGGMSAGGSQRWMSGYEEYLGAMSNRIREAYQIKVGTEEGLMTLKHWLHNHLDGSEIGGVASFYANAPWNLKTLPAGTPEGGKKVITTWGGLPSHAMTITGYNDSIRYDYNQDGFYTNDQDINEDGVLDMRDWEIGGLLFADGWNGGINFGDSGKCYMMYKTLAEKVWEGGIWNNAVHVLDVKGMEKPRLTARIKLRHNKRAMLRIRCGISSADSDTLPDHSISFPVFNFQGGNQYMQGGWTLAENKSIEIGLDISPLLGLFENNDNKQFYLIIDERDPDSTGSGYIEYFSVIDYTGSDPVEFPCAGDSIPIQNNATTYASLLFPTEMDIMEVVTPELPVAVVGEAYSHQMEVEGSKGAVQWSLLHAVHETEIQASFDTMGMFVEPEHYTYGNYMYALPFSFPFYGEEQDTIFISPKGFIMFENNNYPWPYNIDPSLMLKQTKCIAPLLSRYIDMDPSSGQGMWVKEESEKVCISWITSIVYDNYEPQLGFELNIYNDGRINFIYGNDFYAHRLPWICGISLGDQLNYHIPDIAGSIEILDGDAIELEIFPLPTEMQLSDDGVFWGSPQEYYKEVEMMFCAEDDDHVRAFKSFSFSATDLGIDDESFADQNIHVYPNPFRHSVNISFKQNIHDNVSCRIFDLNGKLIKLLTDGRQILSGDMIQWDGSDDAGNACPQGIYFLSISAGQKSVTKKLIYTGS